MAEQPPIETIARETNRIGRDEVAALAAELRAGGDAAWEAPAHCKGWAVKDTVIHVIGAINFLGACTRAALNGQVPLAYDPAQSQAFEAQLRAQPREQVLAQLAQAQHDYAEYLDSLDVAALAFPVSTRFGTFPVWQIAAVIFNEIAIHHWDVRAGQDADARINGETVPLLVDLAIMGAGLLAQGEKTEGVWQLDVDGPGGGPLTLRVRGDQVAVERRPAADAAVRLGLDGEAFVRLVWGRLDLARAIASGRVRVEGDRERALALQRLFCGI